MSSFPPLSIPPAKLKITQKNEVYYVWDKFRKKQVQLTPEEWVRQHFLHYLVDELNYPIGRISVEHALTINQLSRRCDAVVFSADFTPLVVIECKAADVPLTQKTLEQIAQYNFSLRVKYLILTNGIQTVTAFIDEENRSIQYLNEVPGYEGMG
jgi:hypothetical protein